ncbi:hypothetical protein DFP72DRAFT_1074058 [Ephemerocybe angulata]|uniref:Uncharacterized protein n=1 Tax=Ephemerocybe angulata TaxID=980116 RepID=A0A8H6HN24_9AGAR|nr:hypothetical protein DFP72DRAFT_1074058 [Tulosesus angulatus]
MLIAPTLHPDAKMKVPAAVFSFEGKRKFVIKSKKYEGTLEAVRKAFRIDSDARIVLSTSSLDVCRGHAVEIDEAAYPYLWEVLDEVAVATPGTYLTLSTYRGTLLTCVLVGEAPVGSTSKSRVTVTQSEDTTVVYESLSTGPRASGPAAAALRGTTVNREQVAVPTDTQESEQAQVDLVEAELLDTSVGELDIPEGEQEQEEVPDDVAEEYERQRAEEEAQYEHVKHHESSSSRSTSAAKGKSTSVSKAGMSIDELWKDNDVEEVDRYDVYAEPQEVPEEEEQEPSPPASPSPKSRKVKASVLTPAVPSPRIKAEKPSSKKETKFKPKVEPTSRAKTTASATSRDPSPPPPAASSSRKAPKTATSTSTSAPAKDENPRFTIVISGPNEDMSAQFKMRGKHQIHKILKTGCATFGLDHERATLLLVDEDDVDDDGEPQCYELQKNKTALECNIVDGSRLIIQIDDGEDLVNTDEEEEEEDDY